jgi:type II secretory pathway predicted ATPase ExeA
MTAVTAPAALTYYAFADAEQARQRLHEALGDPSETYCLITGETGTGKSFLLRQVRDELDRSRWRVVYFGHAQHLGAPGLVRATAHALRVAPRRSHPETIQAFARQMADEPIQVLLLLDQAHELPPATLVEARTLAEHDLGGARPIRVVIAGLPGLRPQLQATPEMWRRVGVRIELTGLLAEELPEFLVHHVGGEAVARLNPAALALLFERGRGAPGQVLPMVRHLLRRCSTQSIIDERIAEDVLRRWELA